MVEELRQLSRDEFTLAPRFLASKPEHPVPEVSIDRLEVVCAWHPGRFALVRLVGEDQVDLDRAGQDQHPALLVAETIPLLSERPEWGEELGERGRHGSEIVSFDQEVPVRVFPGLARRTRARGPDAANPRMMGDDSNDAFD